MVYYGIKTIRNPKLCGRRFYGLGFQGLVSWGERFGGLGCFLEKHPSRSVRSVLSQFYSLRAVTVEKEFMLRHPANSTVPKASWCLMAWTLIW